MEQRFRLELDEILFLCGDEGTVGIVKSGAKRQIFIETLNEELVMALNPNDLFVASGFGDASTAVKAIKCTLYLIREASSPLIVLSQGHPASSRLNVVVSVGVRTVIRCDIQRGTHPEQDVLCGPLEFHGLEITSQDGEVLIKSGRPIIVERQTF